ncbi:MAG: hypothetical protein HY057_02710 [Rhodospirillales bacterium]|nr:hypothetical protein [Rhodospirillales bacterium]
MDRMTALIVVLAFYVAPLLYVLLAPSAGPFRPPTGSRCPVGPRVGWLVLVLLLGPIGWLMFVTRKRRRNAPPISS